MTNLFTTSMNELELYSELLVDAIHRSRRVEADVIKDMNPMELAYKAAVELNSSVDTFKPLTTICYSLGKMILIGKEKLSEDEETINVRRFAVGYEVISPLLENKKLKLERGRKIRDPYYIVSQDKEFLKNLFYLVNTKPMGIPIPSRPSFEKPEPFKEFEHPVAGDLVRKTNHIAKNYFTMDNCPEVFDAINKHMLTPYVVNTDVLDVYKRCSNDPIFTLEGANYTDQQKEGMLREINGTLDIATGVGRRVFWEYMFYDSRDRIYSAAVYFTPQGSKLSKSLFYFRDKKRIGREGWFWLLVHTANLAGMDKLPIDDRFQYAENRLDEWMVWAQDPVNNKEWQKMDNPYCFLAAIMEINKALKLTQKYNYKSGLPTAWDATCSGLQVLSTISRDEKSGALCNLLDVEEVSDYYKAIADHVWKDIVEQDKSVVFKLKEQLDSLLEIKENAETDEEKKSANEAISDFWFGENDNLNILANDFFSREEVVKMARSLSKRPCMVYFYSCQARTMARQFLRDHQAAFPELNKYFSMWICIRLYNACKEVMPGPTAVMDSFIELSKEKYREGKDFQLIAPRTKFLMMFKYRACKYKKVKINYRGKRIRLKLMVSHNEKLDYQKIISAVSPNIVHMLDGQLVASVLLDTNYKIMCIHDSFSAVPADAGKLYEDVRASYVNLFKEDILQDIFDQCGSKNPIKYGELDVNDIANNQYSFS